VKLLRVVGSLDPAEGGLSQAIRSSAGDLEKLGISTEVASCDGQEASWLGKDAFPVHALGPRKYGFAYTPKLGPWLEGNLSRFDAVIVDGLWLWPSTCATRAVRALRRRAEARDLRPEAKTPKDRNTEELKHRTKQLRCFVMPHGMLDPWFQRDRSRRVKAVRNWFYWWLVERGVVNSADALLFTCQQELELARTTFGGYRPKKEIVVGLGIEVPPAFEPEMREAFAARCPDLAGRPYLLFMSRIHPKKGVDLLVRAYARVRAEVASGELLVTGKQSSEGKVFPDLVVAGPGWDTKYGEEVRTLIDEANKTARAEGGDLRPEVGDRRSEVGSTENCQLPTANSACVHAVDMLSGAAKWGALYGCEAFALPSHQENFGIAVVEALACGKPVLISDQVNIWREILEDGAGLVGEDTEAGVEKLLRQFLERAVTSEGLRVASGAPKECYLKRFAIGPAAASLAKALRGE